MAKRLADNVKKKYVEMGMDGWYSITVTDWFPKSLFEILPPKEQIRQRGYCLSAGSVGGLTYQEVFQILFYLRQFISQFFGGRFKEEFLSKIRKAEIELSQIRRETKNMAYPNKFSVRDDGYPGWRKKIKI